MRLWRLGLRGRLVIAASLLSLATLGVAFGAVSFAVNRSQQKQLDEALFHAAREEAAEVTWTDRADGRAPVISDRPGPAANDVGPLAKYAAVYWPDGRVASATSNFPNQPPPLSDLRQPDAECFDLRMGRDHLRGVVVSIPRYGGAKLLLAVPRTDLDGDATFLARAMLSVFGLAVAWTAALAWWIVGRLTRAHRAIVATTKRVAAGDFKVRVEESVRNDDPEGLAKNVNEMIERLGVLLRGQQRFIAQAAHELRSPLATLFGELSFALRRERNNQEYRATIEAGLDSTRRLKGLSEDLLTLARLGTDPVAVADRVPVAEVIAAAVDSLERDAQSRGVAIEVRANEEAVRGHAGDLERLIRNLLENAIRHAPPASAIVVEAREVGAKVEIAVVDRGEGVKPEERDRLFEAFFRGARVRAGAHMGAGLGLAIARDIARLYGGDITLVSEGSEVPGARFVVTLPAALETEEPPPSWS